ncbi:peptide chain release factor N(5)-glutamine methyltransferase [Aquisalimonas asiatica]|uniref:Release factor glutamine methyltransferase n=1 Tax=Aquisalimonas asiatica TaxID=406100 RepID=A0A1H8VC83_9GAMM|nr:peptide chain release factor N(5)-glutamine methyltransferase [Aquisalimonas asiatica]SEP13016.1 [protein release factor]-glutamine N5-methyltransferase [Aquisalimonas asiatica]
MDRTPASLLRAARQQLDGREADWLLMHVTGLSGARLQLAADEPLDASTATAFRDLVSQRRGGTPLAYLIGTQPFRSLELTVDPRVLIPRPETEELVERALTLVPANGPASVADLGTGSGAIALALKSERPGWRVTAVEASADALAVARANADRLGLDVDWRHGCWFTPLSGQTFDLIVSNPPYVADDDPDLEADVATHEPAGALLAGADGLDAIRCIVAAAPAHLTDTGWLLLEHGHRQGEAVRAILSAAGFSAVRTHRDQQGLERCTEGCLRGDEDHG